MKRVFVVGILLITFLVNPCFADRVHSKAFLKFNGEERERLNTLIGLLNSDTLMAAVRHNIIADKCNCVYIYLHKLPKLLSVLWCIDDS